MGITLFKRKLKNGRTSLYINYSIKGKRKKKALGIILDIPKDKTARDANNEKLKIAKYLVLKRELSNLYEVLNEHTCIDGRTITTPEKKDDIKNANLLNISKEFVISRGYNNRQVKAAMTQLKEYADSDIITPKEITTTFCHSFLNYLKKKYTGNTPSLYFKLFKAFLDYCSEKGLISSNPAVGLRCAKCNATTKNILTHNEIKKMSHTPCRHEEVKRAFLFSCFSGLRWCDIIKLRHSDIDYAHNELTITQQKVSGNSSKALLHLFLNDSAIKLLNAKHHKRNDDGKVFMLPSHVHALKILREWTGTAGINKHITFHCGRHTFITLLISTGADIKTVSSLAGHSNIKQTETYIHTIEENKRKAVNNMPQLPEDYI